jgi:hypothetical protein
MKHSFSKASLRCALFAALALALASCKQDDYFDDSGAGGGIVTLSFSPRSGGHAATRATYNETYDQFFGATDDIFEDSDGNGPGYGRAADRAIGTFRVLIYDEEGDLVQKGNRYWNFAFTCNPSTLNETYEIQITPGTYRFVFIANEQTLSDELGEEFTAPAAIKTLDDLGNLRFEIDADISRDQNIPMVTDIPDVTVSGQNTVEYTDAELGPQRFPKNGTTTWDVPMRRAAIRVSLGIDLGKAQFEAWRAFHAGEHPKVYIDNVPEWTYLLPGRPNVGDGTPENRAEPREIPVNESGQIGKWKIKSDGGAYIFIDRLILPELLFDSPGDIANKALALKAVMRFENVDRATQKEVLLHDDPGVASGYGYGLPRNTWMWAQAEMPDEVNAIVRVLPWGDAGLDPNDLSQYDLTTDRSGFIFRGEASSQRMEILTDDPDGWEFDPEGAPSWITSVTPGSGGAGINAIVAVEVAENDSGKVRKDTLTLRAGNLTRRIIVTQLPTTLSIPDKSVPGLNWVDPPAVSFYVGAFWRADQYGERLIRVKRPKNSSNAFTTDIDGPWTAYVLEGDDWIVLDTEPSPDSGVWTAGGPNADADDSGFDEAHRVPGYETTVSGETLPNDQIYFRIGLNGPYTPTADKPARYGVVLLVYTLWGEPAFQRIWIRQGEGADYLMRPEGETAPNSTMTTRPRAVKWSPYNLTAPDFRDGTVASTQPEVALAAGGGAFTRWPTQAGAFFQWAPLNGIYAFNPGLSTALPHLSHEGSSQESGMNWSLLDQTYETCPTVDGVEFRRPSMSNPYAATTTMNVAYSEMAQSLFLKAVDGGRDEGGATGYNDAGNYEFGLYADGYFDRREYTKPPLYDFGAEVSGMVSGGGHEVAYGGALYFNPATHHSLFFPAAGQGQGNGAHGYSADGYYQSSSKFSAVAVWNLYARFSAGNRTTMSHYIGIPIRCVEGPVMPIPDLVQTVPGMIGIRHSDLGKNPGTFSLTVKGSGGYLTDATYKDLPFVRDHRGEYEDEPVYAVYFKWGSLVAMLGGPNGDTFDHSDVVWWPTDSVGIGYTPQANYNTWGNYYLRPGPPTPATGGPGYKMPDLAASGNNATNAWGDPCKLVDGGTLATPAPWKTPTGGPWTLTDGSGNNSYPFGNQFGDHNDEDQSTPPNVITWDAMRNLGATTRWNDALKGAISDDLTFFLPAAGYRSGGDGASVSPTDGSGTMASVNGTGGYWSSSVTTGNTGGATNTPVTTGFRNYSGSNLTLFLRFSASRVQPSKDLWFSWGLPIRCVPTNP